MKITANYVPQSEHDAVLAERDALARLLHECRVKFTERDKPPTNLMRRIDEVLR